MRESAHGQTTRCCNIAHDKSALLKLDLGTIFILLDMHKRGKSGPKGSSTKGAQASRGRTISLIRQFESSRPARPSPLAASTIRDIPLDLLERIRAFPLFSSAPDSFLAAIGAYLRPQLFSPQEPIVTEGEEAKALYFLVRGGVAVTSKDGESTFAELKPGAFFGEIAILMNMPRSAKYVEASCEHTH